ncbi:hypothetical protein Val02_71900 [Virgisporangium aliadipatigenens]|uniref:Uncharacterized protein n=1 Tax=Virgisporangium aliadipatigenens TaxID=741659 RepID=A0A8J4DU05_9ACTN|nr:ADP-ribosylation family protein [Virgisporangium aliadipatigenens]GIJ50304.1 hypothetical protein Val02_71900 [Virgisporangium aliadipatigenens]
MTDERRAALAEMTGRFPAVAERFRRVYGLRLPRHTAVAAAFFASATPAESAALDRMGLRPAGVLDHFGADGPRLVARDGLDERLHWRYRRDPAEFVTVMSGGSDGLHFGLWYDDPAHLPSLIAFNYARDSAETGTDRCSTILEQVGIHLAHVDRDLRGYGEDTAVLEPLRDALHWFHEIDRASLKEDGPRRLTRLKRPKGGISVGPVLLPGIGDPRLTPAATRHRLADYRDPAAARRHIDLARAELAEGRPAFALTVGGELHWCDVDAFRHEALELLTGAYRALGRDALASIVEVHYANRDLRSVNVLVVGDDR